MRNESHTSIFIRCHIRHLLGSRISLISKKNIRYEGTLYSINESDATVALQNVKSYGTEGREQADGSTFVPPQDAIHPYLVFRGSDIKDLHVHEKVEVPAASVPDPPDPKESAAFPDPPKQPEPTSDTALETSVSKSRDQDLKPSSRPPPKRQPRPRRPPGPQAQVGTGASLLSRTERGVVDTNALPPKDDFDFESNLKKFEPEDDDEEGTDIGTYEKDDFFDSISCDVLDRQHGIDNRLRGAEERNLNTETFGAIALNGDSRRYGRRGGGRGRGRGRGGRGGGGRGRGRGRGYRGGGGNQSSSSSRPVEAS